MKHRILIYIFSISITYLMPLCMYAYYPTVRNFTKDSYRSGAQNWCIAQGEGGNIWSANSEIIEFNGKEWTGYQTLNRTSARSLYYDTKYLIDECNVTGIFYEGGGRSYNFETLKAYANVQLMWDPDMTYDEWLEIMMEYLYMNYGEGGEELYQYILMQTEAGDQCGTCFINNFDRPGDMYSYDYLAEHYEEMRALLVTAHGKAGTDAQRKRIETLLVCCDFMGLSSVHTDWYKNEENKSLYMERYDWMYNYIKNNSMRVFSSAIYQLPSKIDYEVNPMIQFYEHGSRRLNVYP